MWVLLNACLITDGVQVGTAGGDDEADEEVWLVEREGGAGGIFFTVLRADFLSSLSFQKKKETFHIKHFHQSVSQIPSDLADVKYYPY